MHGPPSRSARSPLEAGLSAPTAPPDDHLIVPPEEMAILDPLIRTALARHLLGDQEPPS